MMPILAPSLSPWWMAAAAWEPDVAAAAGAAVVDGDEEEEEEEDDVGEDSAEFTDLTTLAAAFAAPMKLLSGLEVVVAAAILMVD